MTHLPASPDTIGEILNEVLQGAAVRHDGGDEMLRADLIEAKAKLESLLVEARIDELGIAVTKSYQLHDGDERIERYLENRRLTLQSNLPRKGKV